MVKVTWQESDKVGHLPPDAALYFSIKATGQRSGTKWWRKGTCSTPLPIHPPSSPLLGASCLRVFPRRWPKAHNGPSVLCLLQVIQVDVLIQLDHFVHPENVSHSVIREDDDIEVVLQLPLLWVDKGSHDSTDRHALVKESQKDVTGEKTLNKSGFSHLLVCPDETQFTIATESLRRGECKGQSPFQ